jgi:hypothetical protein
VLVAAVAALAAALFAAFGPTYESCEMTSCRRESAVSVNGWWVLIVVALPVVVALASLVLDRRPVRIVAAVLLWAFSIITGFSVGLFFMPAALAMTIAAARSDPVPTAAT